MDRESNVVAVPGPAAASQLRDQRAFQLRQVRRRYSPRETLGAAAASASASTSASAAPAASERCSVLDFALAPSDPDFPFALDALLCSLIVPPGYPGPDPASRPTLRIRNKDIPRGFAVNVERGFDALARERRNATLLGLMTALDHNLELFLSEKRAETVTFVANADKRHLPAPPGQPAPPASPPTDAEALRIASASDPMDVFTPADQADAQRRRETETRQLEARLGRMVLFQKSEDGLEYTLPIEPRKRSELPGSLRGVRTVRLRVPQPYPLQACRIRLDDVDPEDARPVEAAFDKRSSEMRDANLMSHVNYLVQNMHVLSTSGPKSLPDIVERETQEASKPAPTLRGPGDERSHVKVIPRPPEWTAVGPHDGSESDDDDDDSSDSAESEDGRSGPSGPDAPATQISARNPEQGTALSFPSIELYGIELLEVAVLNLTVRCERCKDTRDFNGLKHAIPISEGCKKCACILTVTFRGDLVHGHAVRAGFLDLVGCQVVDMLPSTFGPTCSRCSASYPPPGVISVRGETATATCRGCHQKLTFKIPDVKFLRISPSATVATAASGLPRRGREKLGLVAGTQLPDRGRCRHYAKSYRWFRFGCCDKVYACDRCHDEKETSHANEHASRMICGWCSREQPYRPEECGLCHRPVVGRRASGFWEGGKGTRDQVRMSRRDPRKHKRIGPAKAP